MGIYGLQFAGSSAESALQAFLNDLGNSSNGIDITICTLRLYDQNCQESNSTNENRATDKDQDDENDIAFIVLLIMVITFAITSILLCFVLCCWRYVYKYYIFRMFYASNSMHPTITYICNVCMYILAIHSLCT